MESDLILETIALNKIINDEQAKNIEKEFGTPIYVYSQSILESQAKTALSIPHFAGITVRFAMK